MHNHLMSATVLTSSNISTKLVVTRDRTQVTVDTTKSSLIMKQDAQGLSITLPSNVAERMKCMRSQLPTHLSEILQIYDARGERQIYRILNELELGTDDILITEEISEVSWLEKTSRLASTLEPQPQIEAPGQEIQASTSHSQAYIEIHEVETIVRAASSISISNSRAPAPRFRPLPATFVHELEAPDYWKVLERVDKQARRVANTSQNVVNPTLEDITQLFASLTIRNTDLDPADLPNLFGSDFWLSKFRVGAAGELFVRST